MNIKVGVFSHKFFYHAWLVLGPVGTRHKTAKRAAGQPDISTSAVIIVQCSEMKENRILQVKSYFRFERELRTILSKGNNVGYVIVL